jgi:3-hydroxybutyrate dehydrogenase
VSIIASGTRAAAAGLPIDLRGRVSVVTGGGRGIGRACADALAAAGSDVAVVDIDLAAAANAADALATERGVAAHAIACDVRDPHAVRDAIARALAKFGRLDHLVNNAGVQHVAPIGEFPDARWQDVRAIDLDALFYATKAVWPHLVNAKRGRIINIASVHGLVASPYKAAYVAAKHGVVGLTKVSALEGAEHGITANAICPGAVMTDLIRDQAAGLAHSYGGGISEEEALERAFLAAMPTRRFIEPTEVGALCAFLCSDYAVSITGAAIPIDGGWTTH